MKIKLLGAHNCETASTRLMSILVDDTFALDAGSLTGGLSLDAQKALSAVLLSHQHYDHIRDIPALGMNLYLAKTSIDIYGLLAVQPALERIMDGDLYPAFLARPETKPTLNFKLLEPFKVIKIGRYEVLPVPVKHAVPAVGFQVSQPPSIKRFFYTADTGPELHHAWRHISPQLLITEVTGSNRFEQFGQESGHLTPALLKEELLAFREQKGYIPDIVTVHMSPGLETEIKGQLDEIAGELGINITPGYEGMELEI